MNPAFLWNIHKHCRILAMAKYSSAQARWIPSAAILWKSNREKHVSFLNPADRFDEQEAALRHAMSFATDWCDKHFL
jgi:hypothetical protein